MNATPPLVSIGIPVYNGERYLAGALESLLAQDHHEFELIISDNASGDRTADICWEFQKRDSRIRYIRRPQNQGATWNFASVVHEANGPYFMWAAYDDLRAPSFLRKCIEKLDRHPDAVLCCTEINFIDADGQPNREWSAKGFQNIDTEGMSPAQRIHPLIRFCGWFAIHGLMRLEHTKKLSLGLSVQGWDVIFMMELLTIGNFVKVREPLFSYRIARKKTTADYQEEMNSAGKATPATTTPCTDLAVNLIRVLYGSAFSEADKAAIFADFIHTITASNEYWREQITAELFGASVRLDDSGFAEALNLVLSRAVPSESFRNNPLLLIPACGQSDNGSLLQLAGNLALAARGQ
ncbi:MAG TPA: glycosyltransferase family 2 protein [Candidatus Baltobacteraceae bacterium]|nr:glycosyltransferase family 2 protein [Candidatus Baltobacteraceae bacterium]